MRRRYLGLAGWLLADLSLVLGFIGLSDQSTTASRPDPARGGEEADGGDRSVECHPGIDDQPLRITVDLGGLPLGTGGGAPPPEFARAVQGQVRAALDAADVTGDSVGLVQTFTALPPGLAGQRIPTSYWINSALTAFPELSHMGQIAMDDDAVGADQRVRSYLGDGAPFIAEVEWFVAKGC